MVTQSRWVGIMSQSLIQKHISANLPKVWEPASRYCSKHPSLSCHSRWEKEGRFSRQGNWQEQGRIDTSPGSEQKHRHGLQGWVMGWDIRSRTKAESHIPKSSQYTGKWKSFQVCKRTILPSVGRTIGRVNLGGMGPKADIAVSPFLSKETQNYDHMTSGLLETWKVCMQVGFCSLDSISFVAIQRKLLERNNRPSPWSTRHSLKDWSWNA